MHSLTAVEDRLVLCGGRIAPDGKGVQFAAIKEHLLANAAIEWVWFDFWLCCLR